ncbi:uncharacterized protein VICG_00140 [Vittaforma corneae ATCC 50505]|uniref:T-cell immunomodulatory protein TIP C2 domain-containing protein n=1 Tax=Vittaforma corneae (strain ATCC 50505) TaxID=993615 RepID=L2GQN0_VITCO|nr:uncharacterized protein VICG_00140 [Vittaforma corneae ATCC 50505]ELA42825.1 hypothetical protein VICG_00140 [Vittaforma corneae ATCC 50505]
MRLENVGVKVLLEGYRLFSHAFTTDDEHQKLIALDRNNNIALIETSESQKAAEVKKINTKELGERIVNIISQGFNSKPFPILVTVKRDDMPTVFDNYLCDFESEDIPSTPVFTSNSTPMIITNPKNLKPVILFTNGSKLVYGEIQNESEFVELGSLKPSSVPIGVHTSSYLDVTSDMNADLVLHTKKDGKNAILILQLKFTTSLDDKKSFKFEFEEIQTMEIDEDEIGPIMFTEMASKTRPDMLFISRKGNEYTLNLYKNISYKDEPDNALKDLQRLKEFYREAENLEVYHNASKIVYPLKEILADTKSNVQSRKIILSEDGIPRGMFLYDPFGKGIKSVYIVTDEIDAQKNKPANSIIQVIEFDRAEGRFNFKIDNPEWENDQKLGFVVGLTVFDCEDKGIEQLMVNTISVDGDGSYSFKLINSDHNLEMTGIYLLPLSIADSQTNFIPGACFVLVYENEEKIIKTSLSFQSSYPSLQRHKVFVGLEQTNLFINHFTLKVPGSDENKNQYDAPTFLVPNTFAVFTFDQRDWNIQSFFTNRYYNQTVVSLFVVLFAFIIIYVVLSIQDKKKYKTVMNRDSMRRVFNAL